MAVAAWVAWSAYSAPLSFVQEPAGSGLYSALVNGSFTAIGVASADTGRLKADRRSGQRSPGSGDRTSRPESGS